MGKNYQGMASKLGGRRRVRCAVCGRKVRQSEIVLLTEQGDLGGSIATCEQCRRIR